MAEYAAIHAAQERRRKMMEEEETNMTNYSPDDMENWEFKIVRSSTNAFRKANVLQRVVEEEAQAGWDMVEKFDDGRVRFRRPKTARQRDHLLPRGVDPYRTQYGGNTQAIAVAIGLAVLLLLGGVFALLGMGGGEVDIPVAVWLAGVPVVMIVVGLVAVVFVARNRR